jgi:hypothetical protein
LFIRIAVNIQADWVIEEKVKIFLTEWVVTAPSLPTIADIIINIVWRLLKEIKDTNQRGAIFCQVKIIYIWTQLVCSTIWGSQRWNGAIAILIINVINKNIVCKNKSLVELEIIWLIREIIIIVEAPAWIIKYLIAESLTLVSGLKNKIGIMFKRLISRPSQAVTHEVAETEIKVPAIINVINKKK